MDNNLLKLPAFTENGVRAVIEIGAGTNCKFEINKSTGVIEPDLRHGRPRMVDFLPYPINYGFVPSTKMGKARGGDGDPLDILVICEHLPTGTVMDVLPIGLLLLKDTGEWDNKVLAVPMDPSKRTIQAENFHQLTMNYTAIRYILELFFQNYDGPGVMTLMGWDDEKAAIAEINKWMMPSNQL